MRKEHGNPAIRDFIKERGIKDLQGVHSAVKELTADLIQGILEGELENELGYSKWDYRNKITPNSRNGYSGRECRFFCVN
jgi:transposase-like protein